MAYEITRQIGIDAGHRLYLDPNSKCFNLHGHRYEIQATVYSPSLTNGMAGGVDFSRLKSVMQDVLEFYDHKLILCVNDPLADLLYFNRKEFSIKLALIDNEPTVENLAKLWFRGIQEQVTDLHKIRVYETPNCWADYNGEEA